MANEERVYTVSNAHLDTVWRWTLADTIEKYLPDTISKNFYLFQTIPNYSFNFEGAYRYHLIEEYYPDFFEQLMEYVQQGQWNVCGSSYENGDVNIPSPEALFRNILLGNHYFASKFGKRSKDLFLPDCFGFGFALPAIIKHSNLLGIVTQKLSWGSAYGVPFDIGRWKGVDGSEVFAAINAGDYTRSFKHVRTDEAVLTKLKANTQLGSLPWTLQLHGVGDIGGAPHVASALAVSKAVATNGDNMMDVRSATVDALFQDLAKLPLEQQETLPTFHNELVMTNHGAGCYTSRAMSKRLNRKNEALADRAERSAVIANYLTGYTYPKEVMTTAWKRVIAHQFHDDITGTSLMSVYNQSWNDYYKSLNQFQNELSAATNAVAGAVDSSFVEGIALIVSNNVLCAHTGAVTAQVRMNENSPYVSVFDATGAQVCSQVISKKGKQFEILFTASVPSLGYAVYDVRPSGTKCNLPSQLNVTQHSLENSKYAVRFNKNGDIASIIDKELDCQLLEKPIKFALLKDTGSLQYPSWELRYDDVMHTPTAYANTPTFKVVQNGSAQVAVEITRTAGGSTFVQTVSLSEKGRFVAVENRVDWRSRHTLLKLQFPLRCSNPTATYDLGLGVIHRTNNTKNLYEVPAQKWADLSSPDQDFGVSIFSDSKYGWDKPTDDTLRLTCIHTPLGTFSKTTRQDLQDLGDNRFGFALFSHSGDYTMGTQLQSELYAQPLLAFQSTAKQKGALGARYSFGRISDKGVLLRAMKQAEIGEEIIVRVNEANGFYHDRVALSLGDGIASAREVFASEEPLGDATVIDEQLIFSIDKYAVKTFALTLKEKAIVPALHTDTPLLLDYNADVITDNRNRQSTVMAASGTSLPRELLPASLTCGDILFKLGKDSPRYNAVIAKGQILSLPAGQTKLYLLAATVRGDKTVTFLVDQKPRQLLIHDYMEPLMQWDMYGLEQKATNKTNVVLGLECTHTHCPMDDNFAKPAHFFIYELDVHGGKQLTLPEENTLVILGMTATNPKWSTKLVTPLFDVILPQEKSAPTALTEKVRNSLNYLAIPAGQVEATLGALRNKAPDAIKVFQSFFKKK